jgi:hypothetical protein
VQLSRVPKYIGRGFVPHYFFCSSQQQQIYHCQPDSSFVLSRFSNYLRFYITTNNMYTSIFAVLALAASTLAAPAPIEKRQGAVTCGSTVSVFTTPCQATSNYFMPTTYILRRVLILPTSRATPPPKSPPPSPKAANTTEPTNKSAATTTRTATTTTKASTSESPLRGRSSPSPGVVFTLVVSLLLLSRLLMYGFDC